MYLGRNPAVGTQKMLDSLESQFNGTLTTFDLRYGGVPTYPTLSESLIVSLGGVLQEPGEAYYVSSDRIVFSEAPPAGAECWILLYSQYGTTVSSVPSLAIQATGEPMGFENRTHSSISFDNATRTFSIAPNTSGGYSSYAVWTKGTKRTISATLSVQVGTSTGLYYIYFDAFGDLKYKTTYFTWDTETPVAYVYWNSGTSSAPFVADERHGVVLDWQTHEYLHRTRGAVIAEGFSISAYTTTGNGNVDAHAQFDMGNGTFFDEDLEVNITHSASPTVGTFTQVLTGGAEIPVFYMSGSAGAWVRDSATKYACKQSATTLQYNLLSGSTWSTTPASDNRYVVSWIVATNDITAPVICILGQDQYTAIGTAEEAKFGELVLTNFPIVEFRPLWKVIFQTSTGFTNVPNALIANVLDLRHYSESSISGTIISDHGLLSGLADDDHSQYIHTSLDRVGITANISTTGNLGGANLTITGELRGPSTLVIDPAAVGDNTGTVEIKGNLTVQGNTTTINSTTINVTNLKLEDNEKLYVGTGDDLQIYHNGSNSYIKHNGTGNLYTDIGAADYYQISNSESETIASFQADGAVELYYNGSKKFETTSSGITVTGDTYLNGRIGVGTSTPQTLLEVNLTGAVANTINSTDSSTWGPNGIVNLYNSNGSTTGSEVLLLGSQAGGVGQLASGFGFGRESGADWGTYISFKTHSTSTSNIDELYERVRITSAGNVGIGISSPTELLTVAGNARLDKANSDLFIKIGGTTRGGNTYSNYIDLDNNGYGAPSNWQTASKGDKLILWGGNSPDGESRIGTSATDTVWIKAMGTTAPNAFAVHGAAANSGSPNRLFTITKIGNVGIGTANPAQSLDVKGIIQTTGANGWTTAGDTAWVYFGDNNNRIGGVRDGTIGFYSDYAPLELGAGAGVGSSSGSQLITFKTGTSERARIDNSGRFLVGTSSASAADASIIVQGNGQSSAFGSRLYLARGEATPADAAGLGHINFSDSSHTRSAMIAAVRDGGTWGVSSKPGALTFSTTPDGASAPTERMRITSAGNIGIGSTTPTSKLDVVGSIIASGSVSAAGASGFYSTTYIVNSRNPIWRFANAPEYGLSYFQGSAGVSPAGGGDTIGFHFGTPTAAASLLQLNNGSGAVINGVLGVTGNIDASGIVRATGGRLVLRDDSIENHATDTDTASVVVSYYGYLSGTTRFRDFQLYNGKTGLILKAVGSTGNVGIGSASPTSKLDVVGTVTATNFADATGGYNVNLGSSGLEGRALVVGYSGGSYGGIGYNVRHTTTGGTYIAPLADTSNYLVFNQGFTFLGEGGGAVGRTLSYSNLARLDNSGNFTQYVGGSHHRVAYSSGSDNYSSTLWWNGLALGNNGDNFIVAGRTATGGSLKFYVNNTNDIKTNTTPGGTLALTLASSGSAAFGSTVGIGITPISPLTIAAASTQDNAVYQSWVYSPGNENAYRLDLKQTVTSGVVRYNFSMLNGGTSYTDVLVLDRGNVGIGSTNPAHKLDVAGNIRLGGQLATAATATPAYLSLGTSYSNGYTRANCKIRLYDNGADVYGFSVGPAGDVQYHSTTTHQFYNNDSSSLVINSTGLSTGRDIYVSGRIGGNYGNRLVVGNTDTSYTLQDGNLRPVIQAHGAYPVISLNNTATGNPSHGPTIQFTCSGTGHQFVIGTTGNGSRMDIGFSSTDNWNPHNGISNLLGTTSMSFSTSGNVGIGTLSPAYKLEVNGSFAATTKSFIIPHPTKEGYKLRHGSLEGPENGVYVRGRGDSATIELPEYWTGLVDPDSITVNLTPIGQNSPLWVERIEDNKVYVGREDTSVFYFYTIFAERIDVPTLDVEIKIEEEDE